MSQSNPEHKSQKQENIVKDTKIGRDLTFAPQQIETYIETQIIEISAEKVTQKELNKSSPYKGLKKFNQSDREYFFGRDQLITKFFTAVNNSSFTLVLGASGSGKSSLIRAGLIPEFKKYLDSQIYNFIFTPNEDTFESLYRCLLNEEKDYRFSASDVEFVRQGKPSTLSKLISKLTKENKKSLFFIDQFEQLFIDTNSEKRHNFVEGIVQVAKQEDSFVRIILAMRSDFLEQFSFYQTLSAIANQNNIYLVTPMYSDELRQAIEQPAAKHGVVFEPGLIEQIIKEIEGQSGYLPLLQQTLDLLWEKECTAKSADGRLYIENRVLNKANYAALGGVRGSLQNYVDDIYQNICKENKDGELVTKQIFLKLVNIVESDSGSRVVSRRAYRSELVGKSVENILKRFVNENLLVSNNECLSGKEPLIKDSAKHKKNATIEIAHEILLSSWDKLKRWLEEEKEAIILKNWLAGETKRWLEVRGKDKSKASDELLKGSRLEQIVEFREENIFEKLGGLSQQENKFINVSLKRSEQEAKLAKRRQQLIISGLSSVLIIVSWLFYRVTISEINALSNSAEALSSSNQQLDALVTGLRAGRKIQNNIIGVDKKTEIHLIGRLQSIFDQLKVFNRLEGHREDIDSVVFSPNGKIIASKTGNYSSDKPGDNDNTIKLWNLKGKLIHTLESNTGFKNVVFSPNSQIIAATTNSDTIELYNLGGKLLHTLNTLTEYVSKVIFSPDGSTVISDGENPKLWNLEGELISSFGNVENVVFSPNGKTIVSNTPDGTIKLWNQQGQLLNAIQSHSDSVSSVVFSLDNQIIISSDSQDSNAKVWNLEGKLLHSFNNSENNFNSIVFSPNGKMIAAGSEDKTVKLWNLKGELLRTLEGHEYGIEEVIFSPDGNIIASVDRGYSAKFWKIEGKLIHSFESFNGDISNLAFSPNGRTIAATSGDTNLSLWTLEGELLHTLRGHTDDIVEIIFSFDSKTIFSASWDGTVKLWSLGGELLHSFNGHKHWIQDMALSPDKNNRIIASASNDETIKLWSLDLDNVLARGCDWARDYLICIL